MSKREGGKGAVGGERAGREGGERAIGGGF